ncbi:MAG: hypothetical protein CL483_10345 [Acidobacteria bacterium]|nr:hypothetical protein [Acidobacteriota bacterium]
MAEFNIQSDSVDVTRIMEQIRERIREKRGADYTEEHVRELASVKLERFLDPRQDRSGLVEQYRQLDAAEGQDPIDWSTPSLLGPPPESFEFDTETIYKSSRGPTGKIIQMIRKLLNPFLKLLFNPDPMVHALTRQAEINAYTLQLLQQQTDLAERVTKQFERAGAKFQAREELDSLNYEVLNNLVVEMTRLSVDMKNHMMRVESVAGRLDFAERRARALETVVQHRSTPSTDEAGSRDGDSTSGSGSGRTRRRRRRSRRRGGGSGEADAPAATQPATDGGNGDTPVPTDAAPEPSGGGTSAEASAPAVDTDTASPTPEEPVPSAAAPETAPSVETATLASPPTTGDAGGDAGGPQDTPVSADPEPGERSGDPDEQ